jgi:hypothetical protein
MRRWRQKRHARLAFQITSAVDRQSGRIEHAPKHRLTSEHGLRGSTRLDTRTRRNPLQPAKRHQQHRVFRNPDDLREQLASVVLIAKPTQLANARLDTSHLKQGAARFDDAAARACCPCRTNAGSQL